MHHGNFPTVNYLAKELKKNNYLTYAIYLFSNPPNDIYNYSFQCRGSLKIFLDIIGKISPQYPIYLQAHGKWSFLSIIMRASNPKLKIHQEVYDWMTVFIDENKTRQWIQSKIFDKSTIELMRYSENWIVKNTKGFFYKNHGPRFNKILSNSSSPYMRLLPYPPSEWMRKKSDSNWKNKWQLVYTGQIKNSNDIKEVWGDMNIIPIIKSLTKKNIGVTVFTSVSKNINISHKLNYVDYYDEEKINNNFSIKPFVPLKKLIRIINKQFHFGMLLLYFGKDLIVGTEHIEGAMASKLFTYIAAGLPVLISEEFKEMAKLVSDRNIGIVLRYSDINHLDRILQNVNYNELLVNISLAQKEFCFDNQMEAFFKMINNE